MIMLDFDKKISVLQDYIDSIENVFMVTKTDVTGKIIYANDKFCKLSGYSQKELIGKTHSIIKDPNTSTDLYQKMWKTILQGKVFEGVIKNKNKYGNFFITDMKIIPLFDNNGIREFISIRTDITYYAVQKERDILNASEKLKIVISNGGIINGYNSLAKKIFNGINIGDNFLSSIIKENKYELLPKDEKIFYLKVRHIISNLLTNKKLISNELFKYQGKVYSLELEQLSNDFICSFTDITNIEELKIKHDLELAESKDKMLIVFTHELKSPLNGIIGFSEILSKRLNRCIGKEIRNSDIKKFIELSDDINALGYMLYETIISLLDSAKLREGKYEIERIKFNLNSLLLNIIEIYKRINPEIEIISDINNFDISSDKQSIEHIFINLLSNAIKYGKGKVYLEAKKINNKFEISVHDNGKGIKSNYKDEVFVLFDQLDDKELTRNKKGTGVGLYLVKQLCNILTYDIKIDKSNILGGCMFSVSGDLAYDF